MKSPARRRFSRPSRSSTVESLEARIAPATFFVTNATDNQPGSLRDIIDQANNTPNVGGPDVISFQNIGGGGPFIIMLQSQLPTITESVIIDGYTAPGAQTNTANLGTNALLTVMLDGSQVTGMNGLVFGNDADSDAGGSVVKGLVISGFHPGINESGFGILIKASNITVSGNFIGTNLTGTAVYSGTDGGGATITGNSNAAVGVFQISGAATFTNNIIGGPSPADRNILSGNAYGVLLDSHASGNTVQGNLIGTDKTGSTAIPNNNTGITVIGSGNSVLGNVVSGNNGIGIGIGTGSNTTVTGNIIGLNASGNTLLGNGNSGIRVDNNASGVTIGGNVISGNSGAGIDVGSPFGDGAGDNVTIQGNKIGTDLAGSISVDFGNAKGGIAVYATSSATIGGTSVGDGNVIAWNDGPGVFITNPTAGFATNQGVLISGNSIHNNTGLGIDLKDGNENFYGVTANDSFDTDNGINHLLNFPVITANSNNGTALSLTAAVHAEPNTQYRVEFFVMAPNQVHASGYGEGTVYLGSVTVTTNNSGDAQAVYSGSPGVPVDSYYSATLIDTTTNDTSEFSLAAGPGPVTFTWTGAVSGDWFTPGNWSPNGVPGANDTAIYAGGSNSLSLVGSASVAAFIQNGGIFGGTGSLTVRDNFLWTAGSHNGPSLALAGDATLSGSTPLQWLNGDLKVAGNFAITDSILRFNQGTFTVDATGIVSLSNGIVDGDGTATTSQFFNHGQIIKNGAATFGVVLGSGQNDGTIDIKQGTFQVGAFELIGGQILLDGGNLSTGSSSILLSDGKLSGTGTITGTVNNQFGYLVPGGDGAAGTITINGTYIQGSGGTYLFDVGGLNAGAGYDQVVVNGAANLSGVLIVTYLPGFAPAPGSNFVELAATAVNGTFQFVVGQGLLTPNYTATTAQLTRTGTVYHWDAGGGADTSWDNAANWEFDTVPGANDVAILDINATITVSNGNRTVGDFIQSTGTLSGSSSLNILGSLQWTGGTQSGTGQTITDFSSSSVIKGTSTKTLDGRTLLINGTFDWSDSGLLGLTNGAVIENHGVFQISGDVAFDTTSPSGTFFIDGEGTLRKTSTGTLAFVSGLDFEMDGFFDLQMGTVQVLGSGGANAGTFFVSGSASLELSPSTVFDIDDFVTLTGDGTVTLNGSLDIHTESILEIDSGIFFTFAGGSINFSAFDAYMTVDGAMDWSGGAITGGVHLSVYGNLSLSGSSAKSLTGGKIDYQSGSGGTYEGTGSLTLSNGAILEIGGAVFIDSNVDILGSGGPVGQLHVLTGGQLIRGGDMSNSTISVPTTNAGEISAITGSSLSFTSTFTQTSGVLFVGSLSSISSTSPLQIQGGLVSGYGAILADLNNTGGTVAPGDAAGTIGTLTITGTYNQGSGGRVSFEAASAASHDILAINGLAIFDGTLSFTTLGGFTSASGDNFAVLTHTTTSGTFTTVDIPAGSMLNYNAGNTAVNFSSAPPFNPFEVTTTADTVDSLDGVTSLREAIEAANATPGLDTITFNIPGGGVQTILLSSQLTVTDSIFISGFSQPGASANTLAVGDDSSHLIFLDFSGVGGFGATGIVLAAGSDGSTISGLVFKVNSGTATNAAINIASNGNTITGNFIGVSADGTTSLGLGPGGSGISITGHDNTIGGSSPADRNVISGAGNEAIYIPSGASAATGNKVLGNYIGTDASGNAALGNRFGVISEGPGFEVRNNVIAGSLFQAIYGFSSGWVITGNHIGVGADGSTALANGSGIYFAAGSNNQIGGVNPGEGNVIAYNSGAGVRIDNGTGYSIRGNSIFGNSGLGIDLGGDGANTNDPGDGDGGVNNGQNFPVIATANSTSISGTLNSNAISTFFVDLYASDAGNVSGVGGSRVYLGTVNVTTDTSGNGTFDFDPSSLGLSSGTLITAIATNQSTGDSSEISAGLNFTGPIIVTTELDIVDAADGVLSLREAITIANSILGADVIQFAIPGTGLHMIQLSSALPDITEALTIDGYSQAGASANTLAQGNDAVITIEILSGGTISAGLKVDAANVTITGLIIAGFHNGPLDGAGIHLTSNAANAVIKGNFIGEDPSEGVSTNAIGILVSGATNVTIGGTAPADRNIISGNTDIGLSISSATNITVQGNYIGTDESGTLALGNGEGIHITSSSGTIGGTATGAGNVISGNLANGITLDSGTSGLLVQGNLIGTTKTGTTALGNIGHGIEIRNAGGNTIGGSTAGAGNVISGNLLDGININGSGAGTNFVQGNLIGVGADGTTILGNLGSGVYVSKSNNVIGGTGAGEGNVIAGNGDTGVTVATGAISVQILSNSIGGNTGLGIDLGDDGATANDATDNDSGANNLINFPVLTSATLGSSTVDVSGTVTTDISGMVRVEFFKTDAGGTQGKTYLGFINVAVVQGVAASFTASLSSLGLSDGDRIVATTTDSSSANVGTSEFSANVPAIAPVTVNIGGAAIVEGTGGTKQMIFTVTLSAPVGAPVTVNYSTGDFSSDARNATANVDYTAASGLVTFAAGQVTQTIAIDIITDSIAEARERFVVNLSNPSNAALGNSSSGVGAINDDDHHTIAVGEGSGNSFSVYTTTATGATLVKTVDVFPANYKGGVRVAVGDVNGDGIDDIIAGGGSGSKAVVRVYNGSTLEPLDSVLGNLSAFGSTYRGGVFVASADVNGDGFDDVIVTPSAGSSNQVRIFSGADGSLLNSFRAFGAGSGGVRVATGDVDGDGFDDIVVGTGVGSAVRVFDAMTGSLISGVVNKANTFSKTYRGGVYVAAGDVDGDGRDDVMVSTAAGTPNVRVYLGDGSVPPDTFKAFNSGKLKGARISALDINSDGIADIIATKGRGGENRLSVLSGASSHATLFNLEPLSLQTDGVYVG